MLQPTVSDYVIHELATPSHTPRSTCLVLQAFSWRSREVIQAFAGNSQFHLRLKAVFVCVCVFNQTVQSDVINNNNVNKHSFQLFVCFDLLLFYLLPKAGIQLFFLIVFFP